MKFAICKRRRNETPVQSGLALTPSQMFEMSQKGIPISSSNRPDGEFDLGSEKPFIPLERQRGVDIADLWNFQQATKRKFFKAVEIDAAINAGLSN